MVPTRELIPNLFRSEYRNIVSVLCYLFGIKHIEIAEDIVSDTFLAATETWSLKGTPDNPTAWLYTVAKNKTRNYLKRNSFFEKQLSVDLKYSADKSDIFDIDLSQKNIADSQLAMIFTVCDPAISEESQITLALNLLCGFGIQEIAAAFLTNKEVVYKRLNRAKERLKQVNIAIRQPSHDEINARLDTVLTIMYLLFSEGYYSTSQNKVLRKDVCFEAMRLTRILLENAAINRPAVNALYALMCFHASRFDARVDEEGEMILYDDQDSNLWDQELIIQGLTYLNQAATGDLLSRYHLEAGIAFWHTQKNDEGDKWENILQYYNQLLQIAYSPIAALNRTYALSKANGKAEAICEAEKLQLTSNHFYYSLLGNLYTGVDDQRAISHYQEALKLATTRSDQQTILKNIARLNPDIQ